MRKERVLLEEISDTPLLWRQGDATARIVPNILAVADDSSVRPFQPCQTPQERRLAGTGRAKQDGDRWRILRKMQVRFDRGAAREPFLHFQDQVIGHAVETLRC